jgi:hypothetical protein
MRKLSVLILSFVFLLAPQLRADEGMWLPILLKAIEGDMQATGMKMSAEDIYSVNNSSLKDAVVLFGGGCTGEIISDQGLLLTNHHCGYGRIQAHSSVENDYLKDGFWAQNRSEEIPNPGLSVTFVIRMEDVTQQVLDGISEKTSEPERAALIAQRSESLAQQAVEGTHYGAVVRPFYYGNEYYLIVVETFQDVRLVGAPPSAIGKFGGDTDNWVWPRHTGDFSLFRVYSGPDGKPAEYSEDNIPLKPRHSFPISLKPKKAGDFTLVFGFPGRTQQYLPARAVEYIIDTEDPLKIGLRDLRLEVINREMKKSDKVRIQYASKQSRIANAWKKWQGEVLGLNKTNGLAKKKAYEQNFMEQVNANPQWKKKYGDLLTRFDAFYDKYEKSRYDLMYFFEGAMAIEALDWANEVAELVNVLEKEDATEEEIEEVKEKLERKSKGFFKNYHAPIDQEIMAKILARYQQDYPAEKLKAMFPVLNDKFGGNTETYAAHIFEKSNLLDPERFAEMLEKPKAKKIKKDPAYALARKLAIDYATNTLPAYRALIGEQQLLNRAYMQAQREVLGDEKDFYPDANSTLRVTYGQIEGFQPQDGMSYDHFTTLEGVMAKAATGLDDYEMPERLGELYEAKDFGRYAQDGQLWTCFLASNHTTGGNSGSPVIDAEGNLIGLNFDRCWESTMSDLNYDVSLCRNISVDIRYVLFIIDKYAHAGYLLEEMELVWE